MAGGFYSDPVDVAVEAVPTTLLTAIADNLRCLHKGNGHTSITSIAPAVGGALDVGTVDQTFNVDSSDDTLKFITTAGREVGCTIHLIASETGQIGYGQSSPPVGTKAIVGDGAGSTTLTWQQHRKITLTLGDTYWHHDIVFA